MKARFIAALSVCALLQNVTAAEKTELKDLKEKGSYSLGLSWGNTIKQNDIDVDFEALFQGIRDRASGKTTLMNEQEAQSVMNEFRADHTTRQAAKRKAKGEENRLAGEKFLAENKTKPGVVALPSGLQHKILTPGSGPSPKTNDVVTVHYRGTLLDGTEFDSSHKRGQPATFNLSAVIKGWTEGVSLMNKGAKWQFFIPSNLAYGDGGSGSIPPSAMLTFEVELIDFQSPATPPPLPAPQPVTSDIIKVPSKEEMEKGAKIEVIKAEDLEKLQKEQQEKEKKEKEQKEKKGQ